jgi:hypothetical protein
LEAQSFSVVHFAAPVAESRFSGQLFLQIGRDATLARNESVFTASSLAKVLNDAVSKSRRPAPLILVDTTLPPSLEEAFRQLICRNAFTSQLFAESGNHTVLATGLWTADLELIMMEKFMTGIKGRDASGSIARGLQLFGLSSRVQTHTYHTFPGAACTALFTIDPLLDPIDLHVRRLV